MRNGSCKSERLPTLAAELVALKLDVILAAGPQAIGAAWKAMSSIVIVMAGANDPVGSGFVASLAHPGSNLTGHSLLLENIAPKQPELLVAVTLQLARALGIALPAELLLRADVRIP